MQADQNEPMKRETAFQPLGSSVDEIRRLIREELERYAKDPGSAARNLRESATERAEISASQGLERLLLFLDSMQSTSGRARHLRDFARLHEGTRAATSARILSAQTQVQ